MTPGTDGDDLANGPGDAEGSPGPQGPAESQAAADGGATPAQAGDDPVAAVDVTDDPAAGGAAADDPSLSADADVAEAVELARRFERERDDYLDHLRRLQAEFENYKRRVDAQRVEQRAQAAASLVEELLPVLDACEAAVSHGHDEVRPIRAQLLQTLEKQGLTPVDESGVPFDPHVHEAVMHEDGDGDAVVVEVLRTGYVWNERVVRAAMVKVRG